MQGTRCVPRSSGHSWARLNALRFAPVVSRETRTWFSSVVWRAAAATCGAKPSDSRNQRKSVADRPILTRLSNRSSTGAIELRQNPKHCRAWSAIFIDSSCGAKKSSRSNRLEPMTPVRIQRMAPSRSLHQLRTLKGTCVGGNVSDFHCD